MDEILKEKTQAKKKRGRPRKNAVKPAQKKALPAQPQQYIFVLDIGTRTVVGIIAGVEEGRLRVLDYEQMEHPGRAMLDGQVEDIAKVGALISQVKTRLEKRVQFRLERVAIAAAGRMLKTVRARAQRVLEPRAAADRDIVLGLEGEAIELAQQEVQRAQGQGGFYCVGYSIVEYRMDDMPVAQLMGHICSHASVELIAAFLPNSVVEGLYGAVDVSGLEVVSLTLEPIAAINVLIPPELRLLNLALVDIGAGTSDIAVCRDGVICSYEMATVAGDEVTEAIIRRYLVDFEMAEAIKRKLSLGREACPAIEYENILGLTLSVDYDDVAACARPAVEQLALTIAEKTLKCNGAAPAAFFLIGGGSQIPGLSEALSECLGLDTGNIAIGARRTLKVVDYQGHPALGGPEFVTPLGIAVTALTQESFHFFGVTVNGKRFKLLNTSLMRAIDVLLMAGYRTAEIIGQSGRSLHYTLNGVKRIKKGGFPEQASLFINDKQASVDADVRPGDTVDFTPAKHGEAASATAGELIEGLSLKHQDTGVIFIDGKEYRIGMHLLINGAYAHTSELIRSGDVIEAYVIDTFNELVNHAQLELEAAYYCDGARVYAQMPLLDGARIETSIKASDRALEPDENAREAEQADPPAPPTTSEMALTLNAERIRVSYEGERPLLMNLLERAGVDPLNPQGLLKMLVNKDEVSFTHPLSEGDDVEIGWTEYAHSITE